MDDDRILKELEKINKTLTSIEGNIYALGIFILALVAVALILKEKGWLR